MRMDHTHADPLIDEAMFLCLFLLARMWSLGLIICRGFFKDFFFKKKKGGGFCIIGNNYSRFLIHRPKEQ